MFAAETTIGDHDVAYGLEVRTEDHDEFDRLCRERVRLAVEKGRTFRSSTDKLFWRRKEVRLHLKGRARGLDLQEFPDLLHMEKDSGFAYIVLMGDAEAIATELDQSPEDLAGFLDLIRQSAASTKQEQAPGPAGIKTPH